LKYSDVKKRLLYLKTKGYVPSLRKGPTGIGYTLEKELGLSESNISIPDIGGRVEVKATRRNSKSLITLFTFNKGVWKVPQRDLIEEVGYVNGRGRKALYITIWHNIENPQGLKLLADVKNNILYLIQLATKKLIASWDIYALVGKFMSKFERLLFVVADSRFSKGGIEEFYFNEAYILESPTSRGFIDLIQKSKIGVDIRMYLKENNTVRNHGTGLRINEINIPVIFGCKKNIL
jgi:hypothetical protein